MTLFIRDLDSEGKPKKEHTHCNQCGYTTNSYHGLRVHMAVHRIGPDSYHNKEDLYKSGKYS